MEQEDTSHSDGPEPVQGMLAPGDEPGAGHDRTFQNWTISTV